MKKKILLLPLGLFLLILLTFAYLLIIDRNPQEIPSNLINKKIPNFEANSLFKDEKFIFSQELKSEIVLINFFATWCKPCRDEHSYIKKFSEQKKIRVIGINYKDKDDDAAEFLRGHGDPYDDIGVDKDGLFGIEMGITGVPETFIVDENGKVVIRHVGPIDLGNNLVDP